MWKLKTLFDSNVGQLPSFPPMRILGGYDAKHGVAVFVADVGRALVEEWKRCRRSLVRGERLGWPCSQLGCQENHVREPSE